MGTLKLNLTIEGKYNFRLIKLRPSRKVLLNTREYTEIWNYIIEKLLNSFENQDLIVILKINEILLHEEDLYSLILSKIKNDQYKILAEKKYPPQKIKRNFKEIEFSEHKFILSVKPDELNFLVNQLNDKDALEILITKDRTEKDKLIKFINNEIDDVSRYLNYSIYFNGIHVGLNIEAYNRDESAIRQIVSELKNKNISVNSDSGGHPLLSY